MRTERIWQLPNLPTEASRIPEVRERKGKNPHQPLSPPPSEPEAPKEEDEDTDKPASHLDALA